MTQKLPPSFGQQHSEEKNKHFDQELCSKL